MKKLPFIFLLLFSVTTSISNNSNQNIDFFSKYKNLYPKQLFDTANACFERNRFDTALVGYNFLMAISVRDADLETKKLIIEAYNKAAIIYYYFGDYRSSYDLLIKALHLCEQYGYTAFEEKIFTNIGNIYYIFNEYNLAKSYFAKALSLSVSDKSNAVILNNMGYIEIGNSAFDSAFYYLNAALHVSKKYNEDYLYSVWNNIALLYHKTKNYDSAFYYYDLSLIASRKQNKIIKEAESLAQLGELFFEMKNYDSALYYIGLSNTISDNNNLALFLSNNYLILSKIEESKGRLKKSLEYFKTYANLKDSAYNAEKFGEISQLQRFYEISKTNQQIEQLLLEQKINERTIYYHRTIQFITLGVLILLGVILSYIILQKRKLYAAYNSLVKKDIEIIDYQKNSFETYQEKYKTSALTHDMQEELLNKILTLMEDTDIICDITFSVNKLAELVQSNQKYVSQVINDAFKKNFRSFLNDYRIRAAQLIFSEPDAIKYTIEAVALQVGFRSRNAFRNVFTEITGVTPNFYFKSITKRNKQS